MPEVNILSIQRTTAEERAKILAVDPSVRLVDAGGCFDEEIRDTWNPFAIGRYLQLPGSVATGYRTRQECDRLLAEAEVVIGGWPFPKDLRSRAPNLRWFHQRQAGASNLFDSDLWGSDVVASTSRGVANPLPIAEYAVSAMLYFAMGLNHAAVDRERGEFDHRTYRPLLVQGKTACVVGAGGIGQQVGRLCAALGMRVIGTRRTPEGVFPEGFSELGGAGDLDRLLPQADFVAVCCQWTPETTKLFNRARFMLMKPGAVIVNVARGEIIDEDALFEALQQDRLRGAGLDVYLGEFERLPDSRLWQDPRVLVTPHISGGSDAAIHGGIDLFCDNLRLYLDGKPLKNVIDWQRGY